MNMFLLNNQLKSEKENLENEYKMFGFIFFKLYYQFLQDEGYTPLDLLAIKSTLEKIDQLYKAEKERLMKNIEGITTSDCELLTSIVKAQSHFNYINKAFMEINQKNGITADVELFFNHLVQYIGIATRLWQEDKTIQSEISHFFKKLAEDLRSNKIILENKIKAVKLWDDFPSEEDYYATPLEVYDYDIKLELLRKIKLIERFAACFEENSKRQIYHQDWFIIDEKLKYFKEVLKEREL